MKQLSLFNWPYIARETRYEGTSIETNYAAIFVEDFFGEGEDFLESGYSSNKEDIDKFVNNFMEEWYEQQKIF